MIPEDVVNQFSFLKFTTPGSMTIREVFDNYTKTGDIITLKRLGVNFFKSRSVTIILQIGVKVSQYYTVFKYGHPRPHNNVNSQGKT